MAQLGLDIQPQHIPLVTSQQTKHRSKLWGQPPVHRIRCVTEFSLWHQPGIQREQMLLGAPVITHQFISGVPLEELAEQDFARQERWEYPIS